MRVTPVPLPQPLSPSPALAPGANPLASRGPASAASTLLDALKGDTRANAGDLLGKGSTSNKEAAAEAAKRKLEMLRERLKSIMLAGGDPAKVARAAAQIVKEIGQAAKAYAQAGGSVAGAVASAAAVPAAPGGAAQTAADADAGEGQTAPAEANPDVGSAERRSEAEAGATGNPDGATPGMGSAAEDGAGRKAGPGGESDDPILKAAKKLAESARALFTASAAQAERQGKTDFDQEKKDVAGAEKDLQDAVRAMGGAGSGAYGGGTASAMEPTLSILA